MELANWWFGSISITSQPFRSIFWLLLCSRPSFQRFAVCFVYLSLSFMGSWTPVSSGRKYCNKREGLLSFTNWSFLCYQWSNEWSLHRSTTSIQLHQCWIEASVNRTVLVFWLCVLCILDVRSYIAKLKTCEYEVQEEDGQGGLEHELPNLLLDVDTEWCRWFKKIVKDSVLVLYKYGR